MIIRSRRVVLPDAVQPACIQIDNGRITRVDADARADVDFGDLVISPGLVDTHVHVNEPGRTEWEGFDTATRAAAAGGVTTIVDMPLNSVPATTTVAALEEKRDAARGRCHVDVAFWGGVVPGNTDELDALVDAGVRGFKCFLVPSGVDEFPAVGERELRAALPILARRSVPLLVHAEARDIIAECGVRSAECERPALRPPPSAVRGPQSAVRSPQYRRYLSSRPPEAELAAIEMMVRLAREYGARIHIVHVACAEAVDAIARAKADGVRVTAETCPHYITFAAEDIPDGATEFKCAPPIRERRHRDALRAGLRSGVLDLVATDHSPAPPSMKCRGDFISAWGGIASLELSLASTYSALDSPASTVEGGGLMAWIAQWTSAAPAALAGLAGRKGRIAPGLDADLVVWDPAAAWSVDPSRLQQRHKLTPYAGRTLRGVVHATYLRGERVWSDGRLTRPASGALV